MARVTESSLITTLAGLEQMERERAESERLAREAELEEQRLRERRLAAEAEAAQRRAIWAEQDRQRAELREREQHEARLRAMHEALVESARVEAEARHDRERVVQAHEHERRLLELANDGRLRSLRRRSWFAVALLGVLGIALGGFVIEARARSRELREKNAQVEGLERSLARLEAERDKAMERSSFAQARISLLETKLDAALANAQSSDVPNPSPKPSPPRAESRPKQASDRSSRCVADPNDPMSYCLP